MGRLVRVITYKSAFLGHRSIATYLQRVQSESALIQRISTLEKMMAAWNGLESRKLYMTVQAAMSYPVPLATFPYPRSKELSPRLPSTWPGHTGVLEVLPGPSN